MVGIGGEVFVSLGSRSGGWLPLAAVDPASLLDSLQFTPFVVPFIGSLIVTIATLVYGLSEGRKRGFDRSNLAFVAMMASGTIWTATRVIQLSTAEIWLKQLMAAMMYIGYGGAVVSLFCFALAYTGYERYVTKKNVVLLSVVPAIAFVLAAATTVEPLLWETTVVGGGGDGPVFIDRQFTTLFVPFVAYSYVVLLVGMYLLLKFAVTSQRLYRRQSIAVVLGTLVPMTTGLLFVTNNVPFLPRHIDPTPMGFAVLGTLYAYSVYRFELLDVVPIGRETAWDEMDDAVVTLDPARRVVDCNAAARELFDIDEDYVGQPATTFFAPVSDDFVEQIERSTDVDTQLAARIDGEERHFSLSVSPIGAEEGEQGQVIVLQDITSLKRREAEFDLLRQVQSRVLRHNLRNELNAIRGNAELLADVVDDDYDDRARDVIDASDKLLSISRKARLVEEIVDTDVDAVEYDLPAVLEETVSSARQRYEDATIELDVPGSCCVDASPKLDAAIENLVENAIEHGRPADPHVRISLSDGESPRLSITDNGPGIPDQEVKVLQDGGESQLTHGSGLGLWFVKLVADRSDVDLEFDTGPDGTDVTLQFE